MNRCWTKHNHLKLSESILVEHYHWATIPVGQQWKKYKCDLINLVPWNFNSCSVVMTVGKQAKLMSNHSSVVIAYYQWLLKNHWLSYLIDASLSSERHPDRQLMGLNTVLFGKLNSISEWTIAPWLLFMQLRDNEACTLWQGRVKRVFPMLSLSELHRNSNSDKDLV